MRLQSEPLRKGFEATTGIAVSVVVPVDGAELAIDQRSCIVFHYVDHAAISLIRRRTQKADTLIVCLGCDVYSYQPYIDVHDLVDFYVAPTDLHWRVLASQLYKPVYVLPECVDPIASGAMSRPTPRGVANKRVLWFGYSESFMKSMSSIMPVIDLAIAAGDVESFELIVDKSNFVRKYGSTLGLTMHDYSNEDFLARAADFGYVILSHFVLDLTMNSYIKSPNKAITAILAGLIPICSDTPAYHGVLSRFGLDRLLFSSPLQLGSILKGLDPVADSALLRASGAAASLVQEGSDQQICECFVRVLASFAAREPNLAYKNLSPQEMRPELPRPPLPPSLREHLRDLIPSARRSLDKRLKRFVQRW